MLWPSSQLRVTNLCCNEAVIFGPNIYFHRTATRQKHNYLALGALHQALISGLDLIRKQTVNNGTLPTDAADNPILWNQLYWERRTLLARPSVLQWQKTWYYMLMSLTLSSFVIIACNNTTFLESVKCFKELMLNVTFFDSIESCHYRSGKNRFRHGSYNEDLSVSNDKAFYFPPLVAELLCMTSWQTVINVVWLWMMGPSPSLLCGKKWTSSATYEMTVDASFF